MPKTTIVIPCYNEAGRMKLDRYEIFLQPPLIQLIFVNDGSKDSTGLLLDAWCQTHPSAKVIHFARNQGKAEAVRQGLLAGIADHSEIVGYTDADQATPVEEMRRLTNAFQNISVDINAVFGSRIRRLGARIDRQPVRHYLGRLFATVASFQLGIPVYDTQCGAKLFRTDQALQAALNLPFKSRWIFDVELIGRLLHEYKKLEGNSRNRFLEIPLREWKDVRGSKVNYLSFGRAGIDLVRVVNSLRSYRRT